MKKFVTRNFITIYTCSLIWLETCFIKVFDGSPIPHLTSDDIDYFTIDKLSAKDVLLRLSSKQYQTEAIEYILSIMLKKHFGKTIRNQKKSSDNKHDCTSIIVSKLACPIIN